MKKTTFEAHGSPRSFAVAATLLAISLAASASAFARCEWDFTRGVPAGGHLRKGAELVSGGMRAHTITNLGVVASGYELDAPLTPEWAFRFEVEVVLDDPGAATSHHQGVLWDDMATTYKTTDPYAGFQLVLSPDNHGGWRPVLYLGYSNVVERVFGSALPGAIGQPQRVAFEFRPDGTVTWDYGGRRVQHQFRRHGPLMASARKPVIGDRTVCYFRPLAGVVRRASLIPIEFPRQLVYTVGRAAFVRGEKDAVVTVESCDLMTDEKTRVRVPVETRLRPGWKPISVNLAGRTETVRYGIGPRMAERLPMIMQNSNENVEELAKMGFTCGQFGDGKALFSVTGVPSEDDYQLPAIFRSLDASVVNGVSLSLGPKRPVLLPPGASEEEFYRRDRSGKAMTLRSNAKRPNFEVGDPRVLAYVRECWEKWGELLGGHPAFVQFLPYSEFRDHALPSWNGDAKRYKAETGRDMPQEHSDGRTIDFKPMHRAHPDGVVDDDDPLLAFYRWFWKDGDGWPRYVSAASDAARAGVAKVAPGKTFDTFWDPCVRCPPRWGSGGTATRLGQWVYANPDPMAVAGPAEEVLAMSRGRGQQSFVHTQLMCYRKKMAPVDTEVANPPEWSRRLPKSVGFVSIPPDVFDEATWSMLAKPMDGYSFYPMGSVSVDVQRDGYEMTCPELKDRVCRMMREVVAPLGPMLRRLKRLEPDVAVFECFTSVAMGEMFGWGWHAAPVSMLQRARLDPKVVYEETLERDGFGGIKVLYAPDCGFVTKSMAKKLREFRAAGGVIVADARLAKALEADILVDVQRLYAPPKLDYVEDVEAQEGMSAAVRENRSRTIAMKRRMCADAEKLRQALSNRYVARSDSSSADIVVYNRRWKDVNYLFAVNDARTFGEYVGQWGLIQEKGLPIRGWVETRDEGVKAVYELSRGGKCEFERVNARVRVPVSFETTDGRLFAFLPQEIASVKAVAAWEGPEIVVRMEVCDAGGAPVAALLPVEIRVFAADGDEVDGAGFLAAENGVATARLLPRMDDPKGTFRILCRDRASGFEKTLALSPAK